MELLIRAEEERVEVEERCLPAKTRRRSVVGRFVRRARSDLRVAMEVDGGRVRGITVVLYVSGLVLVVWLVLSEK